MTLTLERIISRVKRLPGESRENRFKAVCSEVEKAIETKEIIAVYMGPGQLPHFTLSEYKMPDDTIMSLAQIKALHLSHNVPHGNQTKK